MDTFVARTSKDEAMLTPSHPHPQQLTKRLEQDNRNKATLGLQNEQSVDDQLVEHDKDQT